MPLMSVCYNVNELQPITATNWIVKRRRLKVSYSSRNQKLISRLCKQLFKVFRKKRDKLTFGYTGLNVFSRKKNFSLHLLWRRRITLISGNAQAYCLWLTQIEFVIKLGDKFSHIHLFKYQFFEQTIMVLTYVEC